VTNWHSKECPTRKLRSFDLRPEQSEVFWLQKIPQRRTNYLSNYYPSDSENYPHLYFPKDEGIVAGASNPSGFT
jgi:hypothetical protein